MNEKLPPKPLAMMPPVMLAVLAVLLSLAWLIPNHTRPWAAFYSDAIAGIVLLAVTLWVFVRSPGKFELVGFGLFFMLLAAVPWLQFAGGVVYSSGSAWINSLYLLGFSLAIFAGWRWEKSTPGQCLDFLFLAIIIAAFVSVGMQLMQWCQQVFDSEWVIGAGKGRFYANMAQPNQLASLLLMAVVGLAWGYVRKAIGGPVATVLILYLLFGVALTESRTAWLNVLVILGGLHFFWGERRPSYFGLALLGFGTYFFVLQFSLPTINDWLFGEAAMRRELADPIRLGIWTSLLGALWERPWFGYGWGQITEAVFSSKGFPDTGSMTKHSHNIILDLLLYNGLAFGGLVVIVLVAMLRPIFGGVRKAGFILPLLAVGVVLVHAMLELPLHYAYFLLPCGMIVGVLALRANDKVLLTSPKWVGLGLVISIACGLWITVADCLEAERTYFNVYFGRKGKAIPPDMQPELMVLTQWRDRLLFANSLPEGALTPERLRWMKGIVVTTPESFLVMALAQNLALSGRPEAAKEWLGHLCKVASSSLVKGLEKQWEIVAEGNDVYRKVDWTRCPARRQLVQVEQL